MIYLIHCYVILDVKYCARYFYWWIVYFDIDLIASMQLWHDQLLFTYSFFLLFCCCRV